MKFQDIKTITARSKIFELSCLKMCSFEPEEIVDLFQVDERIFLTSLERRKMTSEIEIKDIEVMNQIKDFLRKRDPNIISIESVDSQTGRVVISLNYFNDKVPLDVDFYIEEDFYQKVNKKNKNSKTILEKFEEDFLIKRKNTTYAVVGFYVDNEKIKEDSIVIKGKNDYLSLKKKENESGFYYTAGKLLSNIKEEKYIFKIAFGNIKFLEKTFNVLAKAEALNFFNETEKDITSYMNTWEKYGEIEKKIEYERFKKAGIMKFINSEGTVNGNLRLEIESSNKMKRFIENAETGAIISIVEENPEFLLTNFSIEGYLEFLKKTNGKQGVLEEYDGQRSEIVISTEEVHIPKQGYLMLCLSGDIRRFERRESSRNSILMGKSGIPNLSKLLQGEVTSVSRPIKGNIKPLSDTVLKEVFPGHPPTENQVEAIRIALNTPDIAIIQGPPGTGKTTVITAILKRLNELDKNKEKSFGKNLVTAFQHDAVENATERMDIMGIPVPKYGSKAGQRQDTEIINRSTFTWIERNKNMLEEAYPVLKDSNRFSEYELLYKDYNYSSNSIEATLEILEKAKIFFNKGKKMELFEEAVHIIEEIKYEIGQSDESRELVRRAYCIPQTKTSFEDNGEEVALKNLKYFERLEINSLKKELKKMRELIDGGLRDEEFFSSLKDIKSRILLKLLPVEEIFLNSKQRESVSLLLGKGLQELKKDYEKNFDHETRVVMEYLDEIYNNPGYVESTLNKYRGVIGATCQQAVSGNLMKLKGDNENYANVLIDEAARSNPLDLFIPMAKAEERIILVGDHRQLPHIVDESIIREIEKEAVNEEAAEDIRKQISVNIEESLFKRLFANLKKLEEKDGIRRIITLDKQYRTHPVLGKFVSTNFYEKNGETQIQSPRPASEFLHQLPGLENKACVWMDIPFSEGAEIQGQSKSRPAEAKRIAMHLKYMLDSPESEKLSFGIITFYSKQKDIIMKELSDVGIAYLTDAGAYEIKEEYQYSDGRERIRVGTVDSFQGMEFDIVYLSVVRCNKMHAVTENQKRRKYGHLMSDNRLCVSMSRQKKMLIVAGDSEMILQEQGKEAVKALFNYYKMCEEEKEYGNII